MKRRKVLIVVTTVFLLVGVLSVRALWEGRSALTDGDSALASGDTTSAIRYWRRAARWYLPMAPHVGHAYDKLRDLAQTAEAKGDTKTAIAAWTGIRSSVRATRSFYTPYPKRLEEADSRIALLMAGLEEEMGQSSGNLREREAWHYRLLQIDHMPSVAWSIVALLGLALWIGSGFAFALRGVDDSDRLVPKAAAYSGTGILIGLFVWLTGLYFA